MEWTSSDYTAYIKLLKNLKSWKDDSRDGDMHKRILATGKSVIGVRTPDIRRIVGDILKDAKESGTESHRTIDRFLLESRRKKCFETFETSLIYGLVVARTKGFDDYKRRMTPFIEKSDTWAEVDVVVGDSTLFKKLTPEMERWVFGLTEHVDEPFVIRFGLISLMKYFTAEKYRSKVLDACSSVPKDNYYVRMAVAWLLAELFLHDPKAVADYLKEDICADAPHLDVWTHNKAIQKACESFRVSDADKEMLKSLRCYSIRAGKEPDKASLSEAVFSKNGEQ